MKTQDTYILVGTKLLPVMGRRKINIGAKRDDPKWIDRWVASVIVFLDMLHIDSATHAWNLEYVFSIVQQAWVLAKELFIALEVDCINLKGKI